MQEKAGVIAGAIWNVLDQVESMSAKDLKKAVKLKTEKELYLGLGWLLREDKLNITGDEKDPVFLRKNRHKAQRNAKFYINKCRSASCMQGGLKQASA